MAALLIQSTQSYPQQHAAFSTKNASIAFREEEARKAWAAHANMLGDNHPATLTKAQAYAGILEEMGQYTEAGLIYRMVLVEFEKIYGFEHSQVANILNSMANMRWNQGNFLEAEKLYHQAISIQEHALGKDHPDTADLVLQLGLLLQARGNNDQARDLFTRSARDLRLHLGENHPKTRIALQYLTIAA